LGSIAQIGVTVLIPTGAFELGDIGIEQARLADVVEANVGERHVLLEHRRLAAPLRQTVPEDEGIVRPPQHIEPDRRLRHLDAGRGQRHLLGPLAPPNSPSPWLVRTSTWPRKPTYVRPRQAHHRRWDGDRSWSWPAQTTGRCRRDRRR